MEKTETVDQKLDRIRTLLARAPDRFAQQGAVVASYRQYKGRRLGPYYRIAYRDGGRQRSIYLGSSKQVANEVRRLLESAQKPGRQRRSIQRVRQQIRRELAQRKRNLDQQLRSIGLRLQGWETRGWRHLR